MVICIPCTDNIIFDVYYKMYGTHWLKTAGNQKQNGDWVKKGDVISTKPPLTSPINGKIVKLSSSNLDDECRWTKGNDWPKNHGYGRDENWEGTTKVKIRPLKGESIPENLVSLAFQKTIEDMEKILGGQFTSRMKSRVKSMEDYEGYMKELSEITNHIKGAKYKIVPINSMAESVETPHNVSEASAPPKEMTEAKAREFYRYGLKQIIYKDELLDRYTNVIKNKEMVHLHDKAKEAYQMLLKIAA